ncbi:MAG: hypothetical protein GX951_00795 [Mollicutes bacterium]|nr:hypothetical protein [Mollicutes bacterium]
MKRKTRIDFITAICLILCGSIILISPSIKYLNVKLVLLLILTFYGIINLLQFVLTNKAKDFEGLFTMIASIISLILLGILDIDTKPLNLALVLFVWISIMSLIKLKKADYYHDRNKKIWMLRIVTLIIFVISGLLSVINLYYEPEVQILVLGFFYLIHGILELMDPLTNYLIDEKK